LERKVRMRPAALVALLATVLVVGAVVGAVLGVVLYPRLGAIEAGDATIWLVRALPAAEAETVSREIESWPEVREAVYVSEADRLERLQAVTGTALLAGVNGNPFRPSLVLTLSSPLSADQIMVRMRARHEGIALQAESRF
jgi:cell division protein FtsX